MTKPIPTSHCQFAATGQFQIPYPPSNLEAGSATAHEFEVVASNLRDLTGRIALRDKIHSIKVQSASE